ncbi:hypothetical protein [Fibrobacter sp.]|uniref:hypothetical protein n=1 Tax=Fibrobacter sp. TaxID=35828 RepID=UPI003863A74D
MSSLVNTIKTLYEMTHSDKCPDSLFEGVTLDDLNFDDNLAEKFVATSRNILTVTEWVIEHMPENSYDWLLEQAKANFNFDKRAMLIDMHKIPGLDDAFVNAFNLPVILRFSVCKGNTNSGYAKAGIYDEITIYIHTDQPAENIKRDLQRRLPHELRHVADAHDAEMITVYQQTLQNNKSSDKSKYWTDLGEFYARMTEIITLVLKRLKDPEERKHITSVGDMLRKLQNNPTLIKLFQTLPSQYHAQTINALKSIMTKVFASLI